MLVLVFYVPETHLDKVKEALFNAGAGKIGKYSKCCWQVMGEGQFMPEEGSAPHIGKEGNVSKVSEYRVEMVCKSEDVEKIEKALLDSHPYETPAYHFLKASTSANSIQEEKAKLRKKIKDTYKTISREEIAEKSKRVLANLKLLEAWNKADTILAFLSLGDEVDTSCIIEEALTQGKKVAVPRINENDIVFHYITSLSKNSFSKHDYGMYEPLAEAESVSMSDNTKALILTPGIAFDKQCYRLGRGKSFYDRYLSRYGKNCTKAGIAFSFQIRENLPIEDHDVQLDFVVSDENVFKA